MKWIPVNNPPDKDTHCFIACKRNNGSIYNPGYKGYYTIGLQRTLNDPVYAGFMHPNVIAWMPVPEPYTRNKKGWILLSDRYPDKDSEYIVSTYNQFGRERVELAMYNDSKLKFWGQPDVIAWMPVPKLPAA